MRHQSERFVGAGGAGVGDVLLFADVDYDVLRFRGRADNHALVHRDVGSDEHSAALLGVPQTVGGRFACLVRYQTALLTDDDIPLIRLVAVEHMVHDAVAVGVGEKLRAVAHESARGYFKFEVGHAALARVHIEHFGFAGA